MRITIYELLGLIKDGKAPNNVIYKDKIFIYIENEKDYRNEEGDYLITDFDILNDEVEIIDNNKKIEKIDYDEDTTYEWSFGEVYDKINEIIDKINKEVE